MKTILSIILYPLLYVIWIVLNDDNDPVVVRCDGGEPGA